MFVVQIIKSVRIYPQGIRENQWLIINFICFFFYL
jgi:hypothetical protein